MNIGFDLDNIFISTPPFIPKTIIDKLYKKRDNGVLLYRIPGRHEQIVRKLSHINLFRPAIRENMLFLKSLPKGKNKFYLISSRFKFLESETRSLIKKYEMDKIFDGMFFNFNNEQPHVFKRKIINELKLDSYVDDDLSLLNYVAKYTPKTKFFWLDGMNKKKSSHKNIISISKLSEIFS